MLELLLNIFYLVSSDNLSQLSFALGFFFLQKTNDLQNTRW